jgi:hypothetical protein
LLLLVWGWFGDTNKIRYRSGFCILLALSMRQSAFDMFAPSGHVAESGNRPGGAAS